MSASKQGLCSRAFPWVSVKREGAVAVSPLRAVKRMDFGTEFPVPADGLPPAHEEKAAGSPSLPSVPLCPQAPGVETCVGHWGRAGQHRAGGGQFPWLWC